MNHVAVVNKTEPRDMAENLMSIFPQSNRPMNCPKPSVVAPIVASPFVILRALRIPKRSNGKSFFAVVFIGVLSNPVDGGVKKVSILRRLWLSRRR